MRRCTGCGTRLGEDATRCWLCHAPAPEGPARAEVEGWQMAVPREHVQAGPLARLHSYVDAGSFHSGVTSRLRDEVKAGLFRLRNLRRRRLA